MPVDLATRAYNQNSFGNLEAWENIGVLVYADPCRIRRVPCRVMPRAWHRSLEALQGCFETRRRTASTASAEPRKWKYPYYSLPDVIDFAKNVQIGGKDVAEKQILKKLGINSRVTRSWSYRLSSAKEFGLLDRTGRKEDARLVVTELCLRLLTSSGDRLEGARMNALSRPPLYAKLMERYLGVPAPSLEDLASVLVRDFGILDSIAERAARAFLDSARFAGLITADGHIGSPADAGQLQGSARSPHGVTVSEPASGSTDEAASMGGFVAYRFQLRPDVEVVVRLPSALKQSDVARLHKWLRTLPFEDVEE